MMHSTKQWLLLPVSIFWIRPVYGQTPTNSGDTVTQLMLGLLAVIALIFALVWLLKKIGYQGSYQNNRYMKIKASLSLSTKEKLMLIEVGQQHLLVGVGPGFVNHIADIDGDFDEKIENQSSQSGSTLFAEKLKKMLSKGE